MRSLWDLVLPKGCSVVLRYDLAAGGHWIFHEEADGEAARFFPDYMFSPLAEMRKAPQEWLDSVHAYEGGHDAS